MKLKEALNSDEDLNSVYGVLRDGSPVYDDGQEPEVVIGEEESPGSGTDSVEAEVSVGEESSETETESVAEPQSTEETGAAGN